MKRFEVLTLFLLSIAMFHAVSAQYWFQFGAAGGSDSAYNNGASATIQTITSQNINSGSLAFWIGEDLSNGTFLQTGYVVQNQSADYPESCTKSGCTDYSYIPKGSPIWFYEYFPAGYDGSFLGGLGPAGSAGANKTYNNYGFFSQGNTWYFTMNGDILGSIDLGTGISGLNAPDAFGEIANTYNNKGFVEPVNFSNVSVKFNGKFIPLPAGYSYSGYGVGSLQALNNPYGVGELNNRVNLFDVGSGIPVLPNGQQLWKLGYNLDIVSSYGNTNSTLQYGAYKNIRLNEPQYYYINNSTRETFDGWTGEGVGSYTGTNTSAQVIMYGNITETAKWQLQYHENIYSSVGNTTGSGWYNYGSRYQYSVFSNVSYQNGSSRMLFDGWSNGNPSISGIGIATRSYNITAIWKQQYLVNVSTAHGSGFGAGWYFSGSNAMIRILNSTVSTGNNSRLAFYSWDNGSTNSTLRFEVLSPVLLSAVFKPEYLVNLVGQDVNGSRVKMNQFDIDNITINNNSIYFFSGIQYTVTAAYYGDTKMPIGFQVNVTSPQTIAVPVPLYNVNLKTLDVFGRPVDAVALLKFDNGTETSISTGDAGSYIINDVPYGMLQGTVQYAGIKERVSTLEKSSVLVVFIAIIDFVVLGAGVLLAIITYLYSRRELNKRMQEQKNE